MGLEGYEEVDGRSLSNQTTREPEVPPPAPGTFRYDHSKYRPPRGSEEVGEFGGRKEMEVEMPPVAMPVPQRSPGVSRSTPSPFPPSHVSPPPSPAPFSSYTANAVGNPERRSAQIHRGPPDIVLTAPTFSQVEIEKEEESGCCRCVVM